MAKYLRAIEAFNKDDLATFAELLADDCTFDGTAGQFGTSRDQIVKALQQGRESGWLSHNPIGTVAAGEFLVSVYENQYSDGTESPQQAACDSTTTAKLPKFAASTLARARAQSGLRRPWVVRSPSASFP